MHPSPHHSHATLPSWHRLDIAAETLALYTLIYNAFVSIARMRPQLYQALISWMILFTCAGTVSFAHAQAAYPDRTVTVFAAASTKPFMDALAPLLKQRNIILKTVHAGSSVLARQIERGAPADIYISANVRWMDSLADRGMIVLTSKRIIAHNQLVLISSSHFKTAVEVQGKVLTSRFPLRTVLQGERLAIADPDHVPAGIYAHDALTTLKLWTDVQDHLARTQNVTGALMMVARGEAPLGIVYASDVKRSDKVSLLAAFPTSSHSPIAYPAAIIVGHERSEVHEVLDLLTSPQGQAAIQAAGFEGAS